MEKNSEMKATLAKEENLLCRQHRQHKLKKLKNKVETVIERER